MGAHARITGAVFRAIRRENCDLSERGLEEMENGDYGNCLFELYKYCLYNDYTECCFEFADELG